MHFWLQEEIEGEKCKDKRHQSKVSKQAWVGGGVNHCDLYTMHNHKFLKSTVNTDLPLDKMTP